MIFRKRLLFFSIGLIIGIFLVIFIFQGKNASFNYMPNARVIENIISKDSIQFTESENISLQLRILKILFQMARLISKTVIQEISLAVFIG